MKISAIIIVMLVISVSSAYAFPMQELSESHVDENRNSKRGEEVRDKVCFVFGYKRAYFAINYTEGLKLDDLIMLVFHIAARSHPVQEAWG